MIQYCGYFIMMLNDSNKENISPILVEFYLCMWILIPYNLSTLNVGHLDALVVWWSITLDSLITHVVHYFFSLLNLQWWNWIKSVVKPMSYWYLHALTALLVLFESVWRYCWVQRVFFSFENLIFLPFVFLTILFITSIATEKDNYVEVWYIIWCP